MRAEPGVRPVARATPPILRPFVCNWARDDDAPVSVRWRPRVVGRDPTLQVAASEMPQCGLDCRSFSARTARQSGRLHIAIMDPMTTLYIRDVPEQVAATLKDRAASAGMSLSAYVTGELVIDRYTAHERAGGGTPARSRPQWRAGLDTIVDALRAERP